MTKYDKIVRDKIPEIIRDSGGKCSFHLARQMDACVYLIDKIKEEADELLPMLNRNGAIDELADLQEVIIALAEKQNYTIEQVEKVRVIKRRERGGFDQNIILLEATK